MEFGNKLKTLRKNINLTQTQLAKRVGVTKSVISYYENGDRYPSYDVLIKLARTFHVTTDYLLDFETKRTIDVSGLTEDNIAVVQAVVDALKKQSNI